MSDRSIYRIEHGGLPRRVYGARSRIERNGHALVVQTSEGATAQGKAFRHWFGDLRRGRNSIYGGLLRFLDHLHRRGIPMETALLIPKWIEEFIRETWTGSPSPDAGKIVPLHQTGETRKVG